MDREEMRNYVDYVVDRFSEYNPIYLISGDTGFKSEKASRYYLKAMEIIKDKTPEALTTLHIRGGEHELDDRLIDSECLDFYMYQSCHFLEKLEWAYKLPEKFRKKKVTRPIINGEPCYEGITDLETHEERVRRSDTRKAIWQSLLSGAGTGIAYGAHGLWSWHKKGMDFGGETAFDTPFTWSNALRFDGADDAVKAKYIFETYNLFGCEPKDWILNDTQEIRVAAKNENFAIYTPHNKTIEVNKDLSDCELRAFELGAEKINDPAIEITNGKTNIEMGNYNTDRLIVGTA